MRSTLSKGVLKDSIFFKHRYALLFFSYVALYNFIVGTRCELWKVTNITYAYHVVDYSFGIRSNILPGAIFYGLFGEHATRTMASIYETLLLLVFFLVLSFLLERFFFRIENENQKTGLLLILVFLSGPYTFAIFSDELGMLDVYWLFFSLLFFIFLEKRFFRFLIPVLYVLSLAVHFSAVLNYIILFSIVLLYKAALSTERKEKTVYLLIFLLSMLAAVTLFVFFLLKQSSDAVLTIEDFHKIMKERGSEYFIYYDYEFFNWYENRNVISPEIFSVDSPFVRLGRMIYEKLTFTLYSYDNDLFGSALRFATAFSVLAPLVRILYLQFFRLFKSNKDNNMKRFCVFLMMVQFPFTAILGCMFSPDVTRWFAHAFLVSASLLLFVAIYEESIRQYLLEEIRFRIASLPAKMYLATYFSLTLWAYC